MDWGYNQSTKINVDENWSWLQFKFMLGRCLSFCLSLIGAKQQSKKENQKK